MKNEGIRWCSNQEIGLTPAGRRRNFFGFSATIEISKNRNHTLLNRDFLLNLVHFIRPNFHIKPFRPEQNIWGCFQRFCNFFNHISWNCHQTFFIFTDRTFGFSNSISKFRLCDFAIFTLFFNFFPNGSPVQSIVHPLS